MSESRIANTALVACAVTIMDYHGNIKFIEEWLEGRRSLALCIFNSPKLRKILADEIREIRKEDAA